VLSWNVSLSVEGGIFLSPVKQGR